MDATTTTREAAYREAERALWESAGLSPTERRVPFPGMEGTIRIQEVGEGVPTLFIHGGPNSGSTWVPILPFLHDTRALLVDRPGTGLSDDLAIGGVADMEGYGDRFVSSVLDALGVERANVVASSLGGYLALRSAAATPERVGRMVQMACPAGAPGWLTPGFMRALGIGPVRRLLGMLPFNKRASEMILRQIGHGKTLDRGGFPPVFDDWYVALMTHTNTNRNEGELIAKGVTFRGFVPEFTVAPVLASVVAPTLFLWGADDGFGGEDVARATVGAMPNASLEMVPDAGHLPWLDSPTAIGERTSAFLSG